VATGARSNNQIREGGGLGKELLFSGGGVERKEGGKPRELSALSWGKNNKVSEELCQTWGCSGTKLKKSGD